jgi:two-component system, NarL family, sensor kinase
MIISVTIVLLILLIFIVSFMFIYKNRQQRHRVEMESVKEKYNQEILKTQLEIKEQTLKNISEEIHDNVGQVLSLVVLNLSAIELSDTAKAAVKIENTTKLVEKVVADLRNLSKTMDAEIIANKGLTAVIRFELELLEKTGVYKTSFEISGEEKRLMGPQEIVVYRIIQESLNNIIKHAKAAFIRIMLNFSETQLNIQITDDGKGFNIADTEMENIYRSGSGIKNMRKRATLIGGTFGIKSVPSSGTTILIAIPYSKGR